MTKQKKILRRGDSEFPEEFKSLRQAQCDAELISEFIVRQCERQADGITKEKTQCANRNNH